MWSKTKIPVVGNGKEASVVGMVALSLAAELTEPEK
jgi:hypothetical protein